MRSVAAGKDSTCFSMKAMTMGVVCSWVDWCTSYYRPVVLASAPHRHELKVPVGRFTRSAKYSILLPAA